jgi:hypothetical protein
MKDFNTQFKLALIVVQNVLTIAMHIPLEIARIEIRMAQFSDDQFFRRYRLNGVFIRLQLSGKQRLTG